MSKAKPRAAMAQMSHCTGVSRESIEVSSESSAGGGHWTIEEASRPTAAGNGARRARVVYEKPMIHRRAHVLITLLLCLLLTIPGRADAQTSATLVGRVLDASGGVLPGVTVSARQTETGLLRTAVSDTEGRYRIPALPPGLYDIRGEVA